MSLFETIKKDMYAAMKARDKIVATTLRGVLAKLKDRQIDKREDLINAEEIKILQTLAKQRKESIELYKKGNREDLVIAEQKELEVIERYLPQMMSDDDVKKLVKAAIEETGASSMSDIGKVMPMIMKKGAGKIDGKLAQLLLRELLQ
ncbi:MAG: GatB/YqeY domain-containing protein [Candidatus Marinimicrobia bacterium]|nr:GatB/YqeY domain-containing protein [Candidatus Neomarinimicrobiota bacterium]